MNTWRETDINIHTTNPLLECTRDIEIGCGCPPTLKLPPPPPPIKIHQNERVTLTNSETKHRLRKETAGGAWCPKSQIERGIREWLQVDLPGPHVITGVQSQGRYDHGRGQEYVEEYTLEYRRPGFAEWRRYKRWDNKEVRGGYSGVEVSSSQLRSSINRRESDRVKNLVLAVSSDC